MITIFIDNVPYEVKEGQNILKACLSLGFNLPYFCWHPALDSVGACRQCAVKVFKDENDTRGRIVMGCMTAATDGIRLSVKDRDASTFRSQITEWLMLNHPHDCPVCDEGGECHLQDMTVMSGHNYRRTRFAKRTHVNQNLGPFINHEMNRCIQCYRCVRYYRDYAGGRDLDVFSSHDNVYFGRYEEGALESPFSGNLVEICPTGVFTDKTFKEHPTRKWDLETAPSICAQCGLGCNTIAGARYGTLRRILNRYNSEVNRYFLCDRGRFGYEFVNGPDRVTFPIIRPRHAGALTEAPVKQMEEKLHATEEGARKAVDYARAVLRKARRVVGIGSPSASLESNFALRGLVGVDNFSSGLPDIEHRLAQRTLEILTTTPAKNISLAQVEHADSVLVLGEDVVNTAPLLELALRQAVRTTPDAAAEAQLRIPTWDDRAVREAVQDKKGPLFVATPYPVSIDEIAVKSFRGAPEDIARLGNAVAHAIDPENAPEVAGLADSESALAETIAGTLRLGSKPLVVSGSSLKSTAVLEAAANVARALAKSGKEAGLFLTVEEANTIGTAFLDGMSLDDAVRRFTDGDADTVVILENDLYRRIDPAAVDFVMAKAEHVIVLDYLHNETTARAEVLIPAATSVESSGTLVNNEGRAQRFYEVMEPTSTVQASWKWLNLLSNPHYDGALEWDPLDFMLDTIAKQMPLFAPITTIAPPARNGLKIPRESHRYSGRTANIANLSVHEPKPPADDDTPLSYSMEGRRVRVPSPLIARLWAPHWNSVQSLTRFQEEVDGPLRGGDPGVDLVDGRRASAESDYYPEQEESPVEEEGTMLLLPAYHLFGSERTSSLSKAVASRIAPLYLGLSPADAARCGASDGDTVELSFEGPPRNLEVRVIPGMVEGVSTLPAGLTGRSFVPFPLRARVSRVIAKAGVAR
ncbi:MAG TPA: NADH-quinone oxidoreductase subunit NuoG [Spirochaetia bacterium]|nr:NADH-quinone oxidoreductase subunit NuoG [Spirochaetia bacterium]